VHDLSASCSVEADDEYMNRVVEKDLYFKLDTATTENEDQKAPEEEGGAPPKKAKK
jgi:hypothetical protein